MVPTVVVGAEVVEGTASVIVGIGVAVVGAAFVVVGAAFVVVGAGVVGKVNVGLTFSMNQLRSSMSSVKKF